MGLPPQRTANTWTRKTASMCGGYICSLLYRKSVRNHCIEMQKQGSTWWFSWSLNNLDYLSNTTLATASATLSLCNFVWSECIDQHSQHCERPGYHLNNKLLAALQFKATTNMATCLREIKLGHIHVGVYYQILLTISASSKHSWCAPHKKSVLGLNRGLVQLRDNLAITTTISSLTPITTTTTNTTITTTINSLTNHYYGLFQGLNDTAEWAGCYGNKLLIG